jgi:hypothetical protein
MKISQMFGLGKTQAELDFVDIDPAKDTALYVDPHLISVSPHAFAEKCHANLDGFFSHFLQLMRDGHDDDARELFSYLHEPNETCLGVSSGTPSGRGIGSGQADKLFESISKSAAVKSGILEELQDCAIFVRGVERDKVSDMTTNIIRAQLVEYTQEQCKLHGIPVRENTPVGPLWDNDAKEWIHSHTTMLVIGHRPILLVPKNLVSFSKNYNLGKYHTHFVLNYIKRQQFKTNGPFVRRRKLKNGKEKVWVNKSELRDNIAPADKEFTTKFTKKHAPVFADFKKWAASKAKPLTASELRSTEDVGDIAGYLKDKLAEIAPGNEDAGKYHSLIVGILELLFYPSLTCPRKEREINQGRKRIDITFDNSARGGHLYRLHDTHRIPCPYIMVECKNYGREIGNPELDQLIGRFSANRGQVGLLLCRSLQDRPKFLERCRDTYKDKRELILPVTDKDLTKLLKEKQTNPNSRPEEEFLGDLIRDIIVG